MRRIIYHSMATPGMDRAELFRLVYHARVANEQRGLSGFLLFADERFLQVLEGFGIPVHIGADAQGSTEYNSLALGGYRLWVSEADWPAASDILRQSAASAPDSVVTGPRRAIFRFWAATAGASAVFVLPALATFGSLAAGMLLAPLSMLLVPVNPQGRADYYLAAPAKE